MRKVEFTSDQLGKEAYEIYSNSDLHYFLTSFTSSSNGL